MIRPPAVGGVKLAGLLAFRGFDAVAIRKFHRIPAPTILPRMTHSNTPSAHRQHWWVGVLLLLLPVLTAVAQPATPGVLDPMSAGRLFVLAFPDTVGNERDEVFADSRFNEAAVVMIYSPVANRVTITGGNGLARWSAPLDSGRITTIDLMRPEFHDPFGPISPAPSVQRKNAFRVETEAPVTLTCYMATIWGSESWTPLPVEAWGKEYYTAAWPGDIVSGVYYVNRSIRLRAQAAPSEIVVIAAYDDTRITFYPNGPVLSPPSVVTLNANQAFQLRSFVDTMPRTEVFQSDLGGSAIVASRPIGVISGNTRTAIIDERTGLTKNSLKGMAIEWLSPADAHGSMHAFTPVFDDQRVTGTKGEAVATKRPGEVIRVFGSTIDTVRGTLSDPIEAARSFSVGHASFAQLRLDGLQSARYLVTDRPVQAMVAPAGVIRPALGGGYDTWSAFMSELVPREQWTSFAALQAPPVPVGMRHYINIVTDSLAKNDIYLDGGRVRMTMGPIAGSDLVWATLEIPVGAPHVLQGMNGALFTASMYGLLPGSEKTLNGRYREYLALSYGHPLAPARRALRMRDTLVVDSTGDCGSASVRIATVQGSVETIRRIRVEAASNVRLSPQSVLNGPMITPVTLRLETIDTRRDARATLLIEDRAGRIHRVAYARAAEIASLEPGSGLVFGEAMAGDTIEESLVVRNRSSVPLRIRSVSFASGLAGFSLAEPFEPTQLAVDATLPITIRANPQGPVGARVDTAIVELECGDVRLPVTLSVVEPCLEVGDLDFGTLAPGAFATRTLRICNGGRGRLGLLEVAGDSVIAWGDVSFSINRVFLDILRSSRIGPGECVNVDVYFTSDRPGRHETVARLAPAAGPCRDSSTWRAVVTPPSSIDPLYHAESPADLDVDGRIVSFTLDRGAARTARLTVYDALGRRVGGVREWSLGGFERSLQWDASSLVAGVYYCSLSIGDRTIVRALVLR